MGVYNWGVLENIYDIIFDLWGDFRSCRNRAAWLVHYTPARVFLILYPFFILGLSDNAHSFLEFTLITLKILFVSVLSFIVFVLSDTFWFLTKKTYVYTKSLNTQEFITFYLNKNKPVIPQDAEELKAQIQDIQRLHFKDAALRLRNYKIKIVILLLLIFLTSAPFLYFNMAVFIAMMVYKGVYDNEPYEYAFAELLTVTHCVLALYKINPEDCKRFILENENQYMKKLEKVYRVVKKSTGVT